MEYLSETFKVILVLLFTGVLMIVFFQLFKLYQSYREKKIIERVAQLMYTSYSMIHEDGFVLEPVDATRFKTIDLKFVNSVSANLTQLNFFLAGDFNLAKTDNSKVNFPVFYRLLFHTSGTMSASIYHSKSNAALHKVVEFTTEFRGGPMFITSNSTLIAKLNYPEAILFEYQNAHTLPDLLNHHRNRIEQFKAASAKEIEKIHTEEDYKKHYRRKTLIEKQFRGNMLKEDMVDELRRLFFKIKKEQVLQKIADRIIELRSVSK
ncbi:MAG: hypothetical protein CFE21_10125 [Bacteroidetes bacterium B1(2017)]|nr:MAG: hypothetical protein CFE21_10125 [Bacteroidetes bacterium B1(2017)]